MRQGERLLRSGREKRLASDHSITVRGNEWYDHASGTGGLAIDFVRYYYDLSFPEAVTMLLGGEQGQDYKSSKQGRAEVPKEFLLPKAYGDMRRVFAYLIKRRCIRREVLFEFATKKLLFEDDVYHNAVFVGRDENGIARHAHKKSTATNSSFRCNVEGSLPEYSFHYISDNTISHELFVFEAPIDLLSFISLYPDNWKQRSYVAMNGVSEKPILKLLELYPRFDKVLLCLDYDVAGIEASERIYDVLTEKGYSEVERMLPKYKDWNEDLKAGNGLTPIPAKEHPQIMLRDELCEQVSWYLNSNKECSDNAFASALRTYRENPSQRTNALVELASLSVLAAVKEYKRAGYCCDVTMVEERLKYGFKAYQNRGKLENKQKDINYCLAELFPISKNGVQDKKENRALTFEKLASECLKGAILTEILFRQEAMEIQKLSGPEFRMNP